MKNDLQPLLDTLTKDELIALVIAIGEELEELVAKYARQYHEQESLTHFSIERETMQ